MKEQENLHDLLEIIHFTENVSTKIHGVLDEDKIYRAIREESATSKYTVSILLLTDDESKLTIVETFIPPQKLKATEEATGLHLEEYTIDLKKSTIYSQVVREGKTVQVAVADIVRELVPHHTASVVSDMLGYEEKSSILTPLKRDGNIIGVVAVSSTELADWVIPSVRNLAQHISTALELSREYAKRTHAEKSLQESEEALKTIMENVHDVIFQLSPSFLITYVTPNVKDYGYKPEELIGSYLEVTTPKNEVPRALEAVKSVLSGKIVENFEIDQIDSEGEIIPMEVNFTPIKKGNSVVAVQGVMRNSTERRQAEKEKDRILHDLQERVKELSCLYGIDEIMKKNVTMEEILEEIVHLIPPSLQYPEITGCCITYEGNEYKTQNFTKTPWMHTADIINGQKAGIIEVCCTEEPPPEDEGPFLKEEIDLINSIAKRLGEFFERKKSEKALRRAEKKFRDLFDCASDVVCIHDLEGHFLEVNKTARERLGYTREELLQMTPMDIDSPEYAALVPERIEELKKRGHLFFETAHITKEGKKIPIELSSRIIDYEGTPAVLSIARNITERKQAEELLKQSELRYRTLFESVPVGVGIAAFDGYIVACNDAMLEMTGYSKTELEQITVRDMYENPEERDLLLEQVQEYGVVRDFEAILKRKDGSPYVANLTVAVVTLNGEDLLLTMAKDITERKQAEEKLRESEEKYRDLVENINDVIYAIDGRGVITYISPAVESFMGYAPHTVVGHHFSEFIYDEDLPRLKENVQNILSGNTATNEYRVLAKSGDIRWIRTSSRPIFVGDRVVGVQGVLGDITESKHAEEQLTYRLDFEELIATISTHFINLNPNEIDEGITLALEKIGRFTGADCCDIFLLCGDTKINCTHEWCAEGIEPLKDQLQELDVDTFEWGITQLKKLEVLTISRVADLPPEAEVDREALQTEGIKSLLRIPIFIGGVFFGFVGLDSVTEREWSDDTVSMLKMVAEIFANALERKRSEEVLQEREEQYRTTIDSMGDAIHVVDETVRIMLYNKSFERWSEKIGLDTDVVGKTLFEIFSFLPDKVRDEYEHVFTTGKTLITEERTTIGGKEFVTETRKIPIVEEGKVCRVVTVVHDITERKRAEEQLQESEEKFRTLFENQEIGMALGKLDVPPKGNVIPIAFNAALLKFLGYTEEEFCTKTMADVSHPEDLEKDIEFMNEMLAGTRNSYDIERRFIRKDGQIVWGHLTASLLRDTHGNPAHIIASVQDITEQKRSEEALRKSEEEFRLAFENAKDAIFWADPGTGLIIRCNKAAETLLEKKREDIIGCHQTEVHPPEEADYYAEIFKEHTREEEAKDVETEVITTSGEVKPVHISASLTVVGGRPILQGIFRDITERKQAEEKLKESEEKFRGIAERNFDAIFELDTKGCITYVSPAVERITGYTPEEVLGESILKYTVESDIPTTRQVCVSLEKSEPVEGFQVEVVRKDGSFASVEINVSPILKDGKITGSQGVVRDITERKKAEEALRESEEKYRTLVEQSLQGTLIIQGDPPRPVFANTALAEISGYTVEEILSLPPEDIRTVTHPEDRPVFERYAARLEGKPAPPRYEMRIIRKDGDVRWLELRATRIEYQGAPAVQATLIDITERKQAEEQIKQSLKEKEVLLREVHHRVKNNLQVISSLLNLQSEHAGDSRYTEMLKESQNRIRSMALIHEKLYQSENLADIDLDEYITALVTGLVRSYGVSADRVTVKLDVGDVSLGMDAAISCGLIINELVSNSLKYAFPGKRRGDIMVTLHAHNGIVELIVADTGIGIPDTIDFMKTETLGLDLVTTLAEEQLNGDIALDKTKGTAFCITFEEVTP